MEEKLVACPNCKVELPKSMFSVMAALRGDEKHWCPECGHQWGIESKNKPIS